MSIPTYSGTTVTYAWTGPGGAITNNSNELIIDPATAGDSGNYTVSVTVDGCPSDVSLAYTLTVNPLPSAAPTNDGSLCVDSNTDLTLTANASGGTTPYTYQWTGPNSFSSTQANPILPNAGPTESGTYTVVVTDALGCVSNASSTEVEITQRPVQPVITANGPVCANEAVTLSIPTYSGTT
ncbi:MAG: hypothetical protein AAFW73_27300, partial [Bacteroidota bacterium]